MVAQGRGSCDAFLVRQTHLVDRLVCSPPLSCWRAALLTWAYVFINNEVEGQLSIQGITMPEGQALQSLPEEDRAALEQYAGSPMDTGPRPRRTPTTTSSCT